MNGDSDEPTAEHDMARELLDPVVRVHFLEADADDFGDRVREDER
jgi:hypothetical protein